MRSREEYEQAMQLVSLGMNDSEIARATGIPRATVREWRVGEGYRHREGKASRAGIACDGSCSAVEQRAIGWARPYAHLFGLYLGDGTISDQRRGVTRLRIFLDEKYPTIIEGCVRSMSTIRGSDRIGLTTQPGCVEVGSSWKHWKCVLPQAGPGMKHTRQIALEPWQQTIVDDHPDEFLRGLYESDGSRHLNPITRRLPTGVRHYRYSRYMFSNESADIQRLFKETCDALGVHWTQASRKNVAVSRREDVGFLDGFLGPKE